MMASFGCIGTLGCLDLPWQEAKGGGGREKGGPLPITMVCTQKSWYFEYQGSCEFLGAPRTMKQDIP